MCGTETSQSRICKIMQNVCKKMWNMLNLAQIIRGWQIKTKINCHFYIRFSKIKLYYKVRQGDHEIITLYSLLVTLSIGTKFWKVVWQYLLRGIKYLQTFSQ